MRLVSPLSDTDERGRTAAAAGRAAGFADRFDASGLDVAPADRRDGRHVPARCRQQ